MPSFDLFSSLTYSLAAYLTQGQKYLHFPIWKPLLFYVPALSVVWEEHDALLTLGPVLERLFSLETFRILFSRPVFQQFSDMHYQAYVFSEVGPQ